MFKLMLPVSCPDIDLTSTCETHYFCQVLITFSPSNVATKPLCRIHKRLYNKFTTTYSQVMASFCVSCTTSDLSELKTSSTGPNIHAFHQNHQVSFHNTLYRLRQSQGGSGDTPHAKLKIRQVSPTMGTQSIL